MNPADEMAAIVGDRAEDWDRAGAIPRDVVRALAARGLLCPDVPAAFGGLGHDAGEYTAAVGARCGSVRGLVTSQTIAAWTLRRFAPEEVRAALLARLTAGAVAAVAFSEPGAGSDLSALRTTIRADADGVEVDGVKVWVTGGAYADLVLVFGRYGTGGGIVVVDTGRPGVEVTPVADPLGCRAGGHATVRLDRVRLPADALLGGAGLPLGLLVSDPLTHGRRSVAWGCVGLIRTCLAEAVAHARTRSQFGRPIGGHQLVARHLAEIHLAERTATLACAHATRAWADGEPCAVQAAIVAKQVAATGAATAATAAVQVLGAAGATDRHPVARAYRDAKLMELIEGTTELNYLLLAEHLVGVRA